ncbi:hypothetical protein Bbelb_292330 [Branchiostoma belcheri]|nr:hypothetical protein Bbelb_292330 [Branchiostoma belcheri]
MASGGNVNVPDLPLDEQTLGNVFLEVCGHRYEQMFHKFMIADCDGCQVDHPSQRRHHCLFLDVEDMKEYGRRTLASMSFRKMYSDFFGLTAYLCELDQVPSVESMRQKYEKWCQEMHRSIEADEVCDSWSFSLLTRAEDRGLKDETMASYEPPQKKPKKSHKKKGDSKAKRKLVLSEPQQTCIDEWMKQPSKKTVEGVQPIPSTVSPVGVFEMMSNIVNDNGTVETELPAKPATADRTTTFDAEPAPKHVDRHRQRGRRDRAAGQTCNRPPLHHCLRR